MAFKTVVHPDDLRRGDLIDPGWYAVQISGYSEKEAKGDKSTNGIFSFRVIDGKHAGAILGFLLNEKALGFGKKFYAVLGLPKNAEGGYDLDTTLFETIGASEKKLGIYVKRGKNANTGAEYNEVADFRSI
jgi:hypothetical protein